MGKVSGQNWLREQICCVPRPGQPSQGQQGGQGATREKERGRAKIIIKAFVILIKNIGFVSNELQSKKRQSCKIP